MHITPTDWKNLIATAPGATVPWSRHCMLVIVLELLVAGYAGPVFATDLSYKMLSPSFGGNDPQAYTYAEYQFSQKQAAVAANVAAVAAAKAAATAASTAATATSPAQQFADSIVSQLQSIVARNVAQEIANAQPGQAGSIQSGGASITYVNSDGQLSVNITTPAGTTNFSVPSTN